MRVWYFSEMAYHPAWEEGLKRGSLRVVLPSANYDPKIGHQLLNRYLDEFRLCDEVGPAGCVLWRADRQTGPRRDTSPAALLGQSSASWAPVRWFRSRPATGRGQ